MPLFTLFAIILFNVLSILKTSCQEYVIILIISKIERYIATGLDSCLGANKIERLIVKALNSCSGVIIQRLHIG